MGGDALPGIPGKVAGLAESNHHHRLSVE